MKRRTVKRFGVALAVALGLTAGGAFVDGLLPEKAGAAEVGDPVQYQVGDLSVFNTRTRNDSCSVTRVIRNDGPAPLFVIVTAYWDGILTDGDPTNDAGVFPQAAHSPYTGPAWLAPGEQTTAVWSNHGFLPDSEVRLSWSSILQPGVDIGATYLEFVPACAAGEPPVDPTVPSTGPSAPPTTPTLAPPVTDPPSVTTSPAPDTTVPPPPSVVSGPAPTTTTVPVEVLTQQVSRGELPNTGAGFPVAEVVTLGLGLLVTGGSMVRRAGRLTHGEDAS